MRNHRFIGLYHFVTGLAVVGLFCGGAGKVWAGGYDFGVLVETGNDPYNVKTTVAGKTITRIQSEGRLNDNGDVTFLADFNGGRCITERVVTNPGCGIFSAHKDRLLPVPNTSKDRLLLKSGEVLGGRTLIGFGDGDLSYNNLTSSGRVAYFLSYSLPSFGAAIFTHDGSVSGVAVDTGALLTGGGTVRATGAPVLNDNGLIAFPGIRTISSSETGGLFTHMGGVNTLIAKTGDPVGDKTLDFSQFATVSGINNNNNLAFETDFTGGSRGIVTRIGGTLAILVKTGDVVDGKPITNVRMPRINNHNEVAYIGTFPGGTGVFNSDGELLAQTGPGHEIDGVTVTSIGWLGSLNDAGEVLFGNAVALFTRSKAVAVRDDEIEGKTLFDIGTSEINNSGTIAIRSTLLDSSGTFTSAIVLATPIEECVPPPAGLVSWWTGDTDATDIVNGNNGTLTNGALAGVAGKVGGAFQFDGNDDLVVVPDANNLDMTTALTVDAWVNPNTLNDPSDVSAIAAKWMGPTTSRSWVFGIRNSGKLFFMASQGSTDYFVDSTNTVAVGTFSHVAVVYNAGVVEFHINGVKETTSIPATSINTTNNILTIGARNQIFNNFFLFDGLIDEVALFDRALSAAEIQDIFNAGSAGKCKVIDDGDEIPAPTDNCPLVANPDQVDTDGDGMGDACDADDDNDTVVDSSDNCPLNANFDQADADTDTVGDLCDGDDDNDTVVDNADNCPFTPNTDQTDTDNDGQGNVCDGDQDGDGVANNADNCPLAPNADQSNLDMDSVGDACDSDDDGDGIADTEDNCPSVTNPDQTDLDDDDIGDSCDGDLDGDGIDNGIDNCPLVSNVGQDNTDEDSAGDACDTDDDNDGVSDGNDNCPLIVNPDQVDTDADTIGDACDGDLDGDGIANAVDNCPTTANSSQNDFDGDGAGDVCDADLDDDGVANNTPDLCTFTPLGEVVDPATGCSIAELVPCAGPMGTTGAWKNHGQYVSRVAKTAESFVALGLITEAQKNAIISAAAQSNCGQ